MKPRTFPRWATLASLVVAACSTRPPTEFESFVVRAPEPASRRASDPEARAIRVAPPAVAAHIRGLCFVDVDGRVTTLHRARFAAPIDEIVSDALVDRLRAASGRDVVLRPETPFGTDDVLRVAVRRFEIDAAGAAYEAVVALEYVFEFGSGREAKLRSGSIEGRARPASAEPADLVRSLGEALAAALDAIPELSAR